MLRPSLQSLACAAVLAGASPAMAQTTTLYVGSYGGSTEKVFKEKLIPAFEAKNNAKVVYIPGNSTDTLAKLQAQKGKQEFNVVLLDDGPMYQAMQFGFCDKMADAPVYKDLYPIARLGDSAVGVGIVSTGIAYNTEAFKKANLTPPDSWEALTDKRMRQKIAIPPISNTYGLQALLTFARLRKGGDTNIDPGFTAMTKEVGPNVLAWEPSPGKMTELFQNVQALRDTGFPVQFVVPKEGAPALLTAACAVAQNSAPALSQAFVQYLLTPEVQAMLADSQGWGPANSKTKLAPIVAVKVPYGKEQIDKLLPTNWTVVNEKRAEWTNRWNRTVER
jgi:putative spermidine/putrescine transport system substrate-binding protein